MRAGIVTPAVAFFATAVTGAAAWFINSAIRANERKAQKNYPENVLEKNGAVSAVTGGHPEEMNEMPPGVAELAKATPRQAKTNHRKAS